MFHPGKTPDFSIELEKLYKQMKQILFINT